MVSPVVLEWLQSELIESDRTEQAARAEALRRQQKDEERLEARLDVLYEDRLDGRIDTATYDKKASDIRERLEQNPAQDAHQAHAFSRSKRSRGSDGADEQGGRFISGARWRRAAQTAPSGAVGGLLEGGRVADVLPRAVQVIQTAWH